MATGFWEAMCGTTNQYLRVLMKKEHNVLNCTSKPLSGFHTNQEDSSADKLTTKIYIVLYRLSHILLHPSPHPRRAGLNRGERSQQRVGTGWKQKKFPFGLGSVSRKSEFFDLISRPTRAAFCVRPSSF